MAEVNFDFTESGYVPSYDFNFTPLLVGVTVYSILAGSSDNFVAIWADSDAGLETGSFYTASAAAFSVIKDTVLVNAYTTPQIDQSDIIDINV